jgi:hypothetical protein
MTHYFSRLVVIVTIMSPIHFRMAASRFRSMRKMLSRALWLLCVWSAHTQVVLGLTAMCTLAVATVLIGVQKHRPWCGVGLALLSPVYGVGFMVILLVPEKRVRKAEPDAPPNSRPPTQLPTSPEGQTPDSLRTPSSGGCG